MKKKKKKTEKSLTVYCAKCKIPFLKIHFNNKKQTILKWWEGRFHPFSVGDIRWIECFNCGKIIDVEKFYIEEDVTKFIPLIH